MRFGWAFLLWPLAEIATFVLVGSRIGALATVGLVVLSALLGAAVLRLGLSRTAVSRSTLSRTGLRRGAGREMLAAMGDGSLLALGGLLLIVPGFLTDLAAVLLLLPPVRSALLRRMGVDRPQDAETGMPDWSDDAGRRGPTVIDGDYVEVSDESADPPRSPPPPDGRRSGWTRH